MPRTRFVSAEAARRDAGHGVAVDVLLARHGECAVGFFRSRDFDVTIALLADGSTDYAPNTFLAPARRRALAAAGDEIRVPGRDAGSGYDGDADRGGAPRLLGGTDGTDGADTLPVVAQPTDGGGPATPIARLVRGVDDFRNDRAPVRREEARFLLKLTGVWVAASTVLMGAVYWWAVTVSDVPLSEVTVGF